MSRYSIHLTDAYIRSLKFEGAQRRVFDSSLPNFGIRLNKTGIVFIAVVGPSRRMCTLGHYPNMSLKQARQAALRAFDEDEAATSSNVEATDAIDQFVAHKAQ